MDTAGKAVLLSGATVLVSLSAVMLVPSPAFRSMAGGIMLAVVFVLPATLTLLPLVLFKLDRRINKRALKWVHTGEHRSAKFAAWGERLWKRPVVFGLASLVVLLALAAPVLGLKTAMPSIQVLPDDASARIGYDQVQDAFGDGAPGTLQVIADAADAETTAKVLSSDPGIAGAMPAQPAADGTGMALTSSRPCRPSIRPTPSSRRHRRPASRRPARLRPRRWRRGGEPRPQDPARRLHPARYRRRPGPRVPAPPHRVAGAAHRAARHPRQPALDRRSVRCCPPGLPGRHRRRPSLGSSPKASSTPGRRCSSSR